ATEEEGRRADPFAKLLEARRAIAIQLGVTESREWRFILTETFPRYVSAFGEEQLRHVRGTMALNEQDATGLVPDVLRHAADKAEPVWLPVFAAFMQRWQHVDGRDRLESVTGAETAVRQLHGMARPPVSWDRDYLRARIRGYDPALLSRFAATGEPGWAGEGN